VKVGGGEWFIYLSIWHMTWTALTEIRVSM
jgi:hypothetical protein